MALLTVSDLSLGYDAHPVLEHLSFSVGAGDYLLIVGENGAGKTTLIKTLLGLLPPLGGSVTLGGGLRRNEIGYLPQQTDVQKDFPASVREVVRSGCLSRSGLRPFYTRQEKALAEQMMARTRVLDLQNRCYRELSGGQQQRVLLARALCATQRLLLLDEPISGLDPKAAAEMYDMISALSRDGVAVMMISHDLHAAACATHILHLGAEIFFGTKDAFARSAVGKRFLSLEKGGDGNA